MAGATPDPESPEETARICAEARRVVAARRRVGGALGVHPKMDTPIDAEVDDDWANT